MRVSASQPTGTRMMVAGMPRAIHCTKLICRPKLCSSRLRVSTLMMQPAGVIMPPMAAAHGMPIARHFANGDLRPRGVSLASSTP